MNPRKYRECHLAAVRHLNQVDVFTVHEDGRLLQQSATLPTTLSFTTKQLSSDAASGCAVIRNATNLGVYFVNESAQLVSIWMSEWSDWKQVQQIVMPGVREVTPAALVYEDDIFAFCSISSGHQLVHLKCSAKTGWRHESSTIYKGNNITAICALKGSQDKVEVLVIDNGRIVNISFNSRTGQQHQSVVLGPGQTVTAAGSLTAVSQPSGLEVFFMDVEGEIRHSSCQAGSWGEPRQVVQGRRKASPKSTITAAILDKQIDLYYVSARGRVQHTQFSDISRWTWGRPERISDQKIKPKAIYALRSQQNKLDLFYMTQSSEEVVHLSLESHVGKGWKQYKQINLKKSKQFVNLKDVEKEGHKLSEGANGVVYEWKGLAIKVSKFQDQDQMLNQIELWDRLEPGVSKYIVLSEGKVVGFSMKLLKGRRLFDALGSPSNIYHSDIKSKLELFQEIKKEVAKIQNMLVCHADLTVDNIMLNQPDQSKPATEVWLFDFGNGFFMQDDEEEQEEEQVTGARLTGWDFVKPPEARTAKLFSPRGVNPYMLGRVGLQILLNQSYQGYKHRTLQLDPSAQLLNLEDKGFDQEIVETIVNLVSDDPKVRIRQLLNVQHEKQLYPFLDTIKLYAAQGKKRLLGAMSTQISMQLYIVNLTSCVWKSTEQHLFKGRWVLANCSKDKVLRPFSRTAFRAAAHDESGGLSGYIVYQVSSWAEQNVLRNQGYVVFCFSSNAQGNWTQSRIVAVSEKKQKDQVIQEMASGQCRTEEFYRHKHQTSGITLINYVSSGRASKAIFCAVYASDLENSAKEHQLKDKLQGIIQS